MAPPPYMTQAPYGYSPLNNDPSNDICRFQWDTDI
jgi:hypothetical protein